MKKAYKKGILIFGGILIAWLAVFFIDINRVKSLREPIFAIENGYIGSMTKYNGLGYVIGLDKNAATGEISYGQVSIFRKKIISTDEVMRKMYIEPAQLTEEEEKIAALLGLNTKQRIFDFVLDETVQSIQVNTYRLTNGEWKLETGGGGQAFSDAKGRIALGFERIDEGMRIAIQSEHTGGSTEYESERNEELEEIGGYATSVLSEKTEFTYEEEIPLVVQVITSKNELVSYRVDYFEQPEEYEKLGYEGVFAVTIRFSQKTVAELAE